MEKSKNVLFIVLSVFLALAALFGSVLVWKYVWMFQATTMSLSASGKAYYKPDVAEVSVSVVTKGVNPDSVQTENDRKMTGVIDYLKSSGVKEDDIKTVGYNLFPEYEQTENGMNTLRIAGYTLTQTIFFKVREISSTPKIIGGLPDKGINNISGVSFSLSDEKFEEVRAEAQGKAVAKAKGELEKTKSLYGFKKAKLVSINSTPIYPTAFYRDMKALGMGGETPSSSISPIQAGTGELEVSVNLNYELR